jgi:H+/Cl- antiporter ClcA
VHIGAIVGRGLTNTTYLDVALREMQKGHPRLSGWLGCAKTDAFGEMKKRESRISKFKELSRDDEEQLSLLADDDEDGEESGFGSLQPLPKPGYRSRSEQMRALSDMSSEAVLSPEPVTKMSLFVAAQSPPKPERKKQPSNGSAPSEKSKRCNPQFGIISNIVSSLSGFRNDIDRRDLISIGVAVGFAAAFGAPVGGLLYSLEEASSFFSITLMWRTLAATALGTFMIAIYHGDLSRYSILSLSAVDDASVNDTGNSAFMNRFAEIPWYIIIGIGGGLLGSVFNQSYKVTSYGRAKYYGDYKLTEVAVISFLTSSVTFLLPILLPESWTCTDVRPGEDGIGGSDTRYDDLFNCQPGQFNQVAAILLGSRDDALNDILNDPSMFNASTLLMCGLVFLFLMMITFGVALPSGLFMPTLLTGSSFGGFAGIMIQRYYLETIVPAHMALLGAAAMLGGVQRTTVSLCVILMEATGQTKVRRAMLSIFTAIPFPHRESPDD